MVKLIIVVVHENKRNASISVLLFSKRLRREMKVVSRNTFRYFLTDEHRKKSEVLTVSRSSGL
jgi:hypothetical protein